MEHPSSLSPRGFTLTLMVAVAAVAGILTCPSPVSAQDRLFALVPQHSFRAPTQAHLIEIDTRREFFGQIRRDIVVPPTGSVARLYSIGGGRFLVWLSENGDAVYFFDTVTNQAGLVPGLPSGSRIVGVDSSRLRVFLDALGETFIVDGRSRSVRTVSGSSYNTWTLAAHAPSTDRLFVVGPPSLPAEPWIVNVVDVDSGRLERTITLTTRGVLGIAVDPDGRRMFVADSDELQVYDGQSGALLTRIPDLEATGTFFENLLQIDASRGRLLVQLGGAIPPQRFETRVAVFELETMVLLGVISAPFAAHWSLGAQVLSGARSPIYVFSPFFGDRDGCRAARLDAVDPNSGVISPRVDASQVWGALTGASVCRAHLALQSPPTAPTIQSPIVTGHRVTLSWTPAYDAAHYDVEAGTSLGLNTLARVSVGDASLTIDGVPSGRYFVRVRAINVVGRSLPSNEIEVVVP